MSVRARACTQDGPRVHDAAEREKKIKKRPGKICTHARDATCGADVRSCSSGPGVCVCERVREARAGVHVC